MQNRTVITKSEDETRHLAIELTKELEAGDVVLLYGDLGAGKTTFVKGLAQGLGVPENIMTHSPTFTIMNEYPGKLVLMHIDLYRIDYPQQFDELGIEEYLDGKRILAVEWPEKAETSWPKSAIQIKLKRLNSSERNINICIP